MIEIINHGVSRSGTTLIGRILNCMFNDVNLIHTHPPIKTINPNSYIVACHRHPLDTLVSYIRTTVYNCEKIDHIDTKTLNNNANKRLNDYYNFWKDLTKHKRPYLLLKYEKFWNNYEIIIDSIEEFFTTHFKMTSPYISFHVPINRRKKIIKLCSLDNSRKIQERLEQGFEHHDENSLIHSYHISTPEPFGYKKIFTEKQLDFLNEFFKDYIEKWENS